MKTWLQPLTRTCLALAVLMLLLAPGAGAAGEAPDLERLLQETGLKYRTLSPEAFAIPFEARDGRSIEVYLTWWDSDRDFALLFTTVLDLEDQHAFTPDLMREALQLNNGHPTAKFVIDADRGDLDCQTELDATTLTAESLKKHLDLLAAVADDTRARLEALEGAGTAVPGP